MLNMGVNQTLAILRKPYSAIQHDGRARKIAFDAMLETVKIAQGEGVALGEEAPDEAFAVIDTIDPNGKPSTLQDVESERLTEIEMFSGDLLRLAEKQGVTLPVNAILYRLIKTIEEEYSWHSELDI
jgi:2-dehydropantoate 2-reductase